MTMSDQERAEKAAAEAEAKKKKQELIKAKKERAKAERARLVAMGMMTQEEADVADGRVHVRG